MLNIFIATNVSDSQRNLGKTEDSQRSFTWRLMEANGGNCNSYANIALYAPIMRMTYTRFCYVFVVYVLLKRIHKHVRDTLLDFQVGVGVRKFFEKNRTFYSPRGKYFCNFQKKIHSDKTSYPLEI